VQENFEIGSAKVGARGQVVLPVGIRKACGIVAGDTLIVMARPGPGGPSISLMRSDRVARMMAHMEETGKRIRSLVGAPKEKRARGAVISGRR
jgi:bifunctional DNA-binding transcriptional regulator/antitoxin component of YhaV-PrlF toxin-antitoxin module